MMRCRHHGCDGLYSPELPGLVGGYCNRHSHNVKRYGHPETPRERAASELFEAALEVGLGSDADPLPGLRLARAAEAYGRVVRRVGCPTVPGGVLLEAAHGLQGSRLFGVADELATCSTDKAADRWFDALLKELRGAAVAFYDSLPPSFLMATA